jgi:hypothetical protein
MSARPAIFSEPCYHVGGRAILVGPSRATGLRVIAHRNHRVIPLGRQRSGADARVPPPSGLSARSARALCPVAWPTLSLPLSGNNIAGEQRTPSEHFMTSTQLVLSSNQRSSSREDQPEVTGKAAKAEQRLTRADTPSTSISPSGLLAFSSQQHELRPFRSHRRGRTT